MKNILDKLLEKIIPYLFKIDVGFIYVLFVLALLLLIGGFFLYRRTNEPSFIKYPLGVMGTVIVLSILKFLEMHYNDAAIRLQEFQNQAEIIAAEKVPEAIQCDRLVKAARKVQDEDRTMASPAQLEWLIKVKECREQLGGSQKRWDNVKATFETFEKDRSLQNAINIILSMIRLTEFDKTLKPELLKTYETPAKNLESDIGSLKQTIRAMEALIHRYYQDGPASARDMAALLTQCKKIKDQAGLEDIAPLQPTIDKAYDIMRELTKNGFSEPPWTVPSVPVVTSPATRPPSPKKEIILDTSAISDRNLAPLAGLLTEQFNRKGINLSPFFDNDIPRVALEAPEDGRAIMKYPRDSDGNYQYAVSLNVKLLLPPKGKETLLGNIKKAGTGSTESEALRAAQQNVSSDVADKILNTLMIKGN